MAKKTNISPFLDALNSISIKKTETILPIARMTANLSPMVTGDDVGLRTSLVSPVNYDRDLCKVLLKHSEFVLDNQPLKLDYNSFVHQISNIDKLSMLWAIHKSTYENLSDEREITCRNTKCKEKFKVTIPMEELIHEDTYTLWEKVDNEGNPIPFYHYRYAISVPHDDILYEFNTKLPTIGENNEMLSMISTDVLQYNLDNTGSIFSKSQHMALLCDAVRITSKTNSFEPAETSNINEILLTFQNYLPFKIADKFFKQYGEHFDQYVPSFYYNAQCPACGEKFKYTVDLELEFFRTSLYAG